MDHIDDLKLPFDDTLSKTKRGRDADAYYGSHHEIDTVIGHSLGAMVSLALEQQYKQEGDNPFSVLRSCFLFPFLDDQALLLLPYSTLSAKLCENVITITILLMIKL